MRPAFILRQNVLLFSMKFLWLVSEHATLANARRGLATHLAHEAPMPIAGIYQNSRERWILALTGARTGAIPSAPPSFWRNHLLLSNIIAVELDRFRLQRIRAKPDGRAVKSTHSIPSQHQQGNRLPGQRNIQIHLSVLHLQIPLRPKFRELSGFFQFGILLVRKGRR